MARILDKIVQDDAAPSRNDLWLDGETLKANIHGKWKSISGGGSGAGVTIVDSIDKLDDLNVPNGTIVSVAPEGSVVKPSEILMVDFDIMLGFIENGDFAGYQNYLYSIIPLCKVVKNIQITVPTDPVENQAVMLVFGEGNSAEELQTSPQMILVVGGTTTGALAVGAQWQYYDESGEKVKEMYEVCREGIIEHEVLNTVNDIFKNHNLKYFMFEAMASADFHTINNFIDKHIRFSSGNETQTFLKKSNDFSRILEEKDYNDIQNKLNSLTSVRYKHETLDFNSYMIEANVYYDFMRWSSNELTITLKPLENKALYGEYMLQIFQGDSDASLKILDEEGNDSITWIGTPPNLLAGTTTLISIVNNIGVYTTF